MTWATEYMQRKTAGTLGATLGGAAGAILPHIVLPAIGGAVGLDPSVFDAGLKPEVPIASGLMGSMAGGMLEDAGHKQRPT